MDKETPHFKPLDPGRVEMLDQFERQYWCKVLRCSEAELTQAVDQVGAHVTELRDYLAGKRRGAAG